MKQLVDGAFVIAAIFGAFILIPLAQYTLEKGLLFTIVVAFGVGIIVVPHIIITILRVKESLSDCDSDYDSD